MNIHYRYDNIKPTRYFSKEGNCSLSLLDIHFHTSHLITNAMYVLNLLHMCTETTYIFSFKQNNF
jgi:hypothetical protein